VKRGGGRENSPFLRGFPSAFPLKKKSPPPNPRIAEIWVPAKNRKKWEQQWGPEK